MTKCKVDYDDLVMWCEFVAHPHKFMVARAQCERIMRIKKAPTAEQLKSFRENYEIQWLDDDSFEVLPCNL